MTQEYFNNLPRWKKSQIELIAEKRSNESWKSVLDSLHECYNCGEPITGSYEICDSCWKLENLF